jgi:hypothetical protein
VKHPSLPLAALSALLATAYAHAQAHGPAASDIRESGQEIVSGQELRREAWLEARQQAMEQEAQERAESLDPDTRAQRISEVETWLRRLPGRYRIEGRVVGGVPIENETLGGTQMPSFDMRPVTGPIKGVADCSAIGEGVGVHCIINASWPKIEYERIPDYYSGMPFVAPSVNLTPSERVDTMRPAMVVLGLDADLPGIRLMLIAADSMAQSWTGRLEGASATTRHPESCGKAGCYTHFEITAEPGDVVSFVFHAGQAITVDLTMHRDPDAKTDKPLKPLKAR